MTQNSLQRQSVYLRYFHYIIYLVQSIMSAIILILIIQMIFSHKYHILLLHIVNYISHVSALLFLAVLIFMFVTWFRSRKNVLIIMYTISFLLVAANIVVSLVYLEFYLSSSRSLTNQIRPYAIHSYVISSFSTPFTQSLSTLFDVLSLSSFLVIWSATLMLLYQYRYKIGRIKYFALICIPLIYYLFPFEAYFGNIFSPIVLTSPVAFGIIYVLTFSATKQVGAVLFSLGFLSASTLVVNQKVRKALLISAIGIAILFGSIEISPLQYRIFPPYGLITEAFIPLGAYLLLVGIFTSATSVARDTKAAKRILQECNEPI